MFHEIYSSALVQLYFYHFYLIEIPGWWYTYPSEKMMDFVSWDDDIPN